MNLNMTNETTEETTKTTETTEKEFTDTETGGTGGTDEATNEAEKHGTDDPAGGDDADTREKDGKNGTEDDGKDGEPDGKESEGNKDADEAADAEKKRNAEFARRRREAERTREIEKAKAEARTAAIIEVTGGKNPYTGEEMKDAHDVHEYDVMRAIKEAGGDPVGEYPKAIAEEARKQAEAEKKETEQTAFVENDMRDFKEKHPDVNMKTVFEDKAFGAFADGKLGWMPLTDIYDAYQDLIRQTTERMERKYAQAKANEKATPGSGKSNGTAQTGFFSRDQVAHMSKAEKAANAEKIMDSMRKWPKD